MKAEYETDLCPLAPSHLSDILWLECVRSPAAILPRFDRDDRDLQSHRLTPMSRNFQNEFVSPRLPQRCRSAHAPTRPVQFGRKCRSGEVRFTGALYLMASILSVLSTTLCTREGLQVSADMMSGHWLATRLSELPCCERQESQELQNPSVFHVPTHLSFPRFGRIGHNFCPQPALPTAGGRHTPVQQLHQTLRGRRKGHVWQQHPAQGSPKAMLLSRKS